MKFEGINKNDNGDFYILYSIPSKQKITKTVRKQNLTKTAATKE